MGTYRYYCKFFNEITMLLEWMDREIRNPGCEVTINWDEEVQMFCVAFHDITVADDHPF